MPKGPPRRGAEPLGGKEVRYTEGTPDRFENETIPWRFSVVDLEGPWGWRTKAARDWWRYILPKLRLLESMTWAAIQVASGGRRRGTNSHDVKVADLSKRARDRLKEIGQEDIADLFSLRLTGTKRIYGIRDGRALKFLWYDPDHGDNSNAVYRVRPR